MAFVEHTKRIRETSFTSHFEIGLHIYGVVNHTIYMQEYRSGHNEAVLKTVRPKATGVRIPLPAPKNKDTPCGCPLFFPQLEALERPSVTLRVAEWGSHWSRRARSEAAREC